MTSPPTPSTRCCHSVFTQGVLLQVYVSSMHTASVNSLSFAPHEVGFVLASASSDGSIGVLSMNPDGTFLEEKVLPFHHSHFPLALHRPPQTAPFDMLN